MAERLDLDPAELPPGQAHFTLAVSPAASTLATAARMAVADVDAPADQPPGDSAPPLVCVVDVFRRRDPVPNSIPLLVTATVIDGDETHELPPEVHNLHPGKLARAETSVAEFIAERQAEAAERMELFILEKRAVADLRELPDAAEEG